MTNRYDSDAAQWTSRLTFVLAALGSTFGLAGLWRFPYMVTHHGGASFIFAYLICLIVIAVPLAMGELLIGRDSRKSPLMAIQHLATVSNVSHNWVWLGRLSLLSGIIVLALYSVVGGMSLAYIFFLALGEFDGASSLSVMGTLYRLQGSTEVLGLWHTFFLVLVAVVISRGVHKGIAKAIRLLMPLMMVLLVALLFYVREMPSFNLVLSQMFERGITLAYNDWLEALNQAFFTLSLGLGSMMIYGAYLPEKTKIGRAIAFVAFVDVSISVVAGLVIYTLTTQAGLSQEKGFALFFNVLPLAFGSLPQGQFWGTVFFAVVCFAAWSSAISVMEPMVAHIIERYSINRRYVAVGVFMLVWLIGMAALMSFNGLDDYKLAGLSLFALMGIVVSKFLLPATGLMLAIFMGIKVKSSVLQKSLRFKALWHVEVWRFLMGWVMPVIVVIVFVWGVMGMGNRLCLATKAEYDLCYFLVSLHVF